MGTPRENRTLDRVRMVLGTLESRAEPDPDLLARFVARRDEAAFAALVHRHGPMVLRVARRAVGNAHDAEDVFQATFLALSRKAHSIHRQASLASWLYGVAYRLALKARAAAARRRDRDRRPEATPTASPLAQLTVQEAQAIVDEELARLPEKLRAPVVLCCLEGLARDEVGRHLGCPASVVKSRLEQGRERLRQRLVARGLTLPGGFAAVLLLDGAAGAAVPPALAGATIKAALAAGVVRATLAGKVGALAALVVAIGVLAAGAGGGRHEPGHPPAGREKPVVGATAAHEDPLPAGASARLGSLRFRLGGHIGQIAFSPDGKVVAAASADDAVCLFDVASGRQVRRFWLATPAITPGLAFSPDGQVLASSENATISRRDWQTGAELPSFALTSCVASSLLFSPDGKLLACIGRNPNSKENVVAILDADSGKELHRVVGLKNYIAPRVAFSPDSRTFAYADLKAAAVKILDSRTGKTLHALEGHTKAARTVAFSPDGKVVASTSDGEGLRFWDVATGKPLPGTGRFGACNNLSYTPDGRFLVGGGVGSGAYLYDLATGKEMTRRTGPSDTDHREVLISPGGKLFASAHHHTIRLWDAATHRPVLPPAGHEGEVSAVAFAPDGHTVYSTAGEPGILHRWDAATGKPLTPLGGFRDYVSALACSPDGRLLAVGTGNHETTVSLPRGPGLQRVALWDRGSGVYEGTVVLLDAATGKLVRKLGIPRGSVTSLAFSADGKTLVSGYQDETHVWDAETGKLRSVVRADSRVLTDVAVSPDGRTIAAASLNDLTQGTIRLWDAATGKELPQMAGNAGGTYAVAFSPVGATLASGGAQDGTIRLWNLASRKPLWQASGHEGWVRFVAFSPDGKMIATGGRYSPVYLWEAATGKQRGRYAGHRTSVRTAAFSPDGRLLATGSADTTVLLWDLARVGDRPAAPPSAKDLDGLWADLAGEDARKAYLAIAGLAQAGPQSVPFLKQHLAPAPKADGMAVARLIAALDSDRFAEREKAASELLKLGEAALPAVRDALAGRPSAEARRRLKGVLGQLEAWGPQRLRAWRAVEALERIGTREARQVLKGLAEDGAPGAELTREAAAALARLANRPARPPSR